MNCPFCGSDTRICDTQKSAHRVRRRRECKECGQRLTTVELRKEDLDALLELAGVAVQEFAAVVNTALESMALPYAIDNLLRLTSEVVLPVEEIPKEGKT